MFVSGENFVAPELTPRLPSRGVQSFWQGLASNFEAERIETDSYGQLGSLQAEVRDRIRSAVTEAMGEDEVNRRLAENAPRREQPGRRERRESGLILQMAQEAAQSSPDLFRGLPTTSDEFDTFVREEYQAEYQDVMDTAGMVGVMPGVASFLGRSAAALTDPTSIMLGLASGGTGSVARIFLRESALGAAAEAAILPRQNQMADYLNIERPNAAAQIALGAALGGAFYGGLTVATRAGRAQVSQEYARALEYARSRVQQVPDYAPEKGVEAQAAIDEAERIATENDAIFDFTPSDTPPERPTERPQDVIPAQPDQMAQDDVEASLRAEIERLQQEEGLPPKPMSRYLMQREPERLPDGTIRTSQIRPGGQAAQTLQSLGITSRSRPGLFSRRGQDDLDNLPADELEGEFPGITDLAGRSDDGIYINQEGFLQQLARELNNETVDIGPNRRIRELEEQLAEYQRLRDLADEPIEPVDYGGDAVELSDEMERVRGQVNDALVGRGIDEMLTAEEKDALVNIIGQYGGRIDDSLDEIDRADLQRAGADEHRYADLPWDDPRNAAEPPQGSSDPATRGPDAAAAGSGRAGDQADRSPRTEPTAAGEQQLIEGVEPITARDRLQEAMGARMGGDARGPDSEVGGLFDPHDKARMDLFDDPMGEGLFGANKAAADDMREFLESNPEFSEVGVTIEVEPGVMETRSPKDWLDDMDGDEAFLKEVNMCRIGGPQ
jgi:hypothetical protein